MNRPEKHLRSLVSYCDSDLLVLQTSKRAIIPNLFWASVYLFLALYFRNKPEYHFNVFYIFFFWCLAFYVYSNLKSALQKVIRKSTDAWAMGEDNFFRIHGIFRRKSEKIPLSEVSYAKLAPTSFLQFILRVRTIELVLDEPHNKTLVLEDVANAKVDFANFDERISNYQRLALLTSQD